MSTAAFVHHARRTLRRAAEHAALAPSIHNTQPWQMHLDGEALNLDLDLARWLPVVDPDRRQAIISCGCALLNARAAIAATGAGCVVERFPDGIASNRIARLSVSTDPEPGDRTLAELDASVAVRTTNRTHFTSSAGSHSIVGRLAAAAEADGAVLVEIHHDEHRDALAALSRQADAAQNADPAYRAELRRWTTDDPDRTDGVPAYAVPHVDGRSGDEIPIRDFDTHGAGRLPARTESSRTGTILVLGTYEDDPAAWLRTGEALERVLLELTRYGYAASPLNQVLEIAWTRDEFRRKADLTFEPQFLLRVGRAAMTPPTPRRPLSEVLREDDVD